MKYHLILTLDYELFGNGSGCLRHCVQAPTEQCLDTLASVDAPMSFFVDASEFLALKNHPEQFSDYPIIEQQLTQAMSNGHSLQLHLHPQWLNARFDRDEWQLDLSRWRIGDLNQADLEQSLNEGWDYLNSLIIGDKTRHLTTFRAGGWAIQPALRVLKALYDKGVRLESTVAPGAFNWAGGDWYDFSKAPNLPFWHIERDVCQAELPSSERSQLLEVPICSARIGRFRHAKMLKALKVRPPFPSGCYGTYDGPNSSAQSWLGKLSKVVNIGHCMLDFSTVSGDVLIDMTRQHMAKFSNIPHPVPIVAIGHNKNFTEASNQALSQWLHWAKQTPEITFSDYHQWHTALNEQA